METRSLLLLGAACAASAFAASACAAGPDPGSPTPERPNIVLINADDLGYGDLGCYGATLLRTPNLDRLAREGRRFTDAHSASAVCSPSRYGLLTGRYPLRRNLWGPVGADGTLVIGTGRTTLASLLSECGYATACIGKWHLGMGAPVASPGEIIWNGTLDPGPLELGFDHFYGIPTVNSGPPFVLVEDHHVVGLDPSDPFVRGKRSVTQEWPAKGGYNRLGGAEQAHRAYRDTELATVFVERSVRWLTRTHAADPKRPFFLYLATTNIHHPFTPAERFLGTSDCGRYGDFVHELDWVVGEVLGALDDLGVADETLVLFTSDNGAMLNHGGQDAWTAGHRPNGELLGFKFGAWEGGHRVPLIARWPGRVPAGTVSDQLISQVDLLATFAALLDRADVLPEDVDSLDALPALVGTGDAGRAPRRHLVVSPNSPAHLLVRRDQWVYIPAQGEGGFTGRQPGDHTFGGPAALPFAGRRNSDVVDGKLAADAPPAQLYDLDRDPAQTTNVVADHPGVVAELDELLERYRDQVGPDPRLGWIVPQWN
jgi:arylsulfatase A